MTRRQARNLVARSLGDGWKRRYKVKWQHRGGCELIRREARQPRTSRAAAGRRLRSVVGGRVPPSRVRLHEGGDMLNPTPYVPSPPNTWIPGGIALALWFLRWLRG